MSSNLPNFQLQGNRIVYCFSDAAGANACQATFLMNRDPDRKAWLFSNRQHGKIDPGIIISSGHPDFDALEADLFFMGTSHPQSSDYFELRALRSAKNKGIYSIAFIDHWTNFRLRFIDENGAALFPDEIWVVDEKAKQLGLEEGLPSALLKVRGNPYHEYLRSCWRPKWQGKSYLDFMGINGGGFYLLFAPDPLSLRYSREWTGFHEGEALGSLLEIIRGFRDKTIHVIIKSHPLQPVEILKAVLDTYKLTGCTLVTSANTLELIWACDLVVGFYSNILLDAFALGKPVVRYFPGRAEADLLSHSALPRAGDDAALQYLIKKNIYG